MAVEMRNKRVPTTEPSGPLHVRWFRSWHPVLDGALSCLPEMPRCPHELFRLVARNPTPLVKTMALVTDGREPVAVAALRARRGHWESITEDGISPRNVMPVRPGSLFRVLRALRDRGLPAPPPVLA